MKARTILTLTLLAFLLLPLLPTHDGGQASFLTPVQAVKKDVPVRAGWKNRFNYEVEYSNGTRRLTAYTGPQVFWDNSTNTWKELEFIDEYATEGRYTIRNAHVTVQIFDNHAKYYDPDYKHVAVHNERFEVERWDSASDKWMNIGIHDAPATFTIIQNETGVYVTRTQSNSYGILNVTYIVKPGAMLKHEITFTSNLDGNVTFRVIMKLLGITGTKILHEKGGKRVNAVESLGKQPYFLVGENRESLRLQEYLYSLGVYDENGTWIPTILQDIEVDTHPNGMKATIYIGNYTLSRGETLEIDPTTSTWQIDAGVNDANQYGTLWSYQFFYASSRIDLRNSWDPDAVKHGGWRFPNINIPKGSTIDSAYLEIHEYPDAASSNIHVRIYGHAHDNSPDFATDQTIVNREKTSASVTWDGPYDSNTWDATSDFASVVQEIIDRPGWSSGNAITILLFGRGDYWSANDAYYCGYEYGSSYAAKLQVTYTPPPPSIGEFQAPSLIGANEYFYLNATIKDVDGVNDFVNATVQFNGVRLKWINSTNTFDEDYDPNNYVGLGTNHQRISINSTAYKLCWNITLHANFTAGWVSIEEAGTKIFDAGGNSGSSSYNNLFLFDFGIYSFETPSTVYANKYFFLNVTIKNVAGITDWTNATIELSNGVILKWDNSTDAFSEYSDPNNYCTLDAAGSTKTQIDSETLKLSWKIKLAWNYTEGSVDVVSTNTKVFDGSGNSASHSQAGLFTFEDDLIVASASVDDDVVNPSQSLTFSGTLYYEGTSTAPEDTSGITVKVELSGTLKNSTTTINADGTFSISATAESAVDSYSYIIYAVTDENSVQNGTVQVVVDRLVVTFSANNTEPSTGEAVTISWNITREYNGEAISAFTIDIMRNGTAWRTGLTNNSCTDVQDIGVTYTYDAGSVSESTYGLNTFIFTGVTVTWIPNQPPTIGEFQAPATVYANKFFLLNVTIVDPDGITDLVNSTIEISNSIILKWDNATDGFSLLQDAYGYCTLDAAASFKTQLNSTAYKLSFRIKLGWTFPEGAVDIVLANTKCFDSYGESGSNSHASLFTFEDDLIVASASVDDSRINPGDTVTFTGFLYYEGTSIPPEDPSGITAKVELGGALKGSTTTINADGSFSISFAGESSIAAYQYNVYVVTDENSVQNQTVTVIVDALKVDSYSIDMASAKVYAHMVYAYDGSPVQNGIVNLAGLSATTNSTGWATFDMSSASDFNWGQTAYGVQDGAYGITYKMQNQTLPIARKNRLIQSDAEISALSWDGVKLAVEFTNTGTYTLKVSGSRPTYILNATYDLSTDYTDYLTLSHDGSRRIVIAYPNWGDFYIRSLSAGVLTNAYWTDQKFTLVLNGTSGATGTLTIYCGSRGMPKAWTGFDADPEYNAETTILSGQYTFGSPITITLDFAMPTSSGSGGTGTGGAFTPKISVMIGGIRRLTLYPGESATTLLNLTWTGVNSINILNVVFTGAASDWVTLAEPLPKTIFKDVGSETGVGEIEIRIIAPENAQPGEYTVPVTIQAEAVGSRIETNGYITFSVVQAPTPVSLVPDYMTWIFAAVLAAITLYAYLKD